MTITALTDRKDQSVTTQYGDLGLPGTVIVYGKGVEHNLTLQSGGGSATVKGFESLFG